MSPSTADQVPPDAGGPYLVRIDYTNTSAQIIDRSGACVAHYGPGVTRTTLAGFINPDGWYLLPDPAWTETNPPDGRQSPVVYRAPGGTRREHADARTHRPNPVMVSPRGPRRARAGGRAVRTG